MNTTTTTSAAASPDGRQPLPARNVAIAALGIVSALIAAAGVAIGGGTPTPSHPPASPATSAPAALRTGTSTTQ
jgi:hypothetical protein